MTNKTPNLNTSSLSCDFSQDGVLVKLSIYCIEGTDEWSLEVINESGTSIVWDDIFTSDADAYAAFLEVVAEEGMSAFADSGNVIEFPKRN